MLQWFTQLSPILQALIATTGTWLLTALGASIVFAFRNVSQKVLDAMFGFAGGVMLAASFWSLLAPAEEMAVDEGVLPWIPMSVGFMAGGLFLWGVDKVLPHIHPSLKEGPPEGVPTQWRRSILLVLAITLHNFPEGLAVGVSFGAASQIESATLSAAIALAIGIGLQNFPEGVAVAMPLRREGMGRFKSFWYGQLSAIVEPIAGVLGAAFVLVAQPILPYALSFAAGAMVFVVVEEVIPSAQENGNADLVTMSVMIGFTVMMVLDVALG